MRAAGPATLSASGALLGAGPEVLPGLPGGRVSSEGSHLLPRGRSKQGGQGPGLLIN